MVDCPRVSKSGGQIGAEILNVLRDIIELPFGGK